MRSLGRYEIRATLGRGAMGTVYKIIVPGINKIAAAKTFDPSKGAVTQIGSRSLQEQFIHEASIIANIRHINVVNIWSLEEVDSRLFYVMEYFCHNLGICIGETYFADAPSRIIPVEDAVHYITDVLRGLFCLHSAGIVHRDIKPFNIMLTDDGISKIVDFGLSKRRGEKTVLKNGIFLGTKPYSAPEQVDDPDTLDHRADLFSVGVMLYRMLTGILPQVIPELPSSANPLLDDHWDALILKSMAPIPGERFNDARQMIGAIETAYEYYKKKRTAECEMERHLEGSSAEASLFQTKVSLRAKATRVLAKHAKSIFELDDLHRPQTYLPKIIETIRHDILFDKITGLVWQQSGSEFPMPWATASKYIAQLNATEFGGYKHWRLPTINELSSLLLRPVSIADTCFDDHFSSTQKWIWSGDSRSAKAAWLINVEMGFVTSADVLDSCYVRAVCSL